MRSTPSAALRPPDTSPVRGYRDLLVVLACVIALGVAGFAWAFSSPIGSSPDDDFHQSSIWCPHPLETSGCRLQYDDEGAVTGAYVPEMVRYASECYAARPNQSAACVDDLGVTLVPSDRIDQGRYPGGYYRVMNALVGEDPIRSILVMRLVNVAVAMLVFSLVGAVMPRPGRRMMTLALLGMAVPLTAFLLGSVNPSSWAIVGLVTAWLSGYALAISTTAGRRIVAGALVLVGAAMAAASRSDAAAYVGVALLALLILTWRQLHRRAQLVIIPVLALASAVGVASFLLANQKSALTTGFGEDSGRNPVDVLFYNVTELPDILVGFSGAGVFSGLGWLDTAMPAITHVSVAAVVAGLVAIGVRVMWPEKLLSLAVIVSALVALPLLVLQRSNALVGESVQPRYLLPLMIVALATALAGRPNEESPGLTSTQTIVVYTLLVLANSFGLHANIRRYVTGQDVRAFNLGQGAEWWWSFGPSPMEVWAIGSLAFAVGALLLLRVRESRPPGMR